MAITYDESPVPTPSGNVEWYLYWLLFEVRAIREILEEDTGIGVLRDSSNNPLLDQDGQDFLSGA